MSGAKRLLIVDDSELICLTLSALFEDQGFEVEIAECLAEGRALLDGPRVFDLVLLDLKLGHESGLELVPAIASRHADTKIVLATGASKDETAGIQGVDATVAKGGEFDELHALVTRLLS